MYGGIAMSMSEPNNQPRNTWVHDAVYKQWSYLHPSPYRVKRIVASQTQNWRRENFWEKHFRRESQINQTSISSRNDEHPNTGEAAQTSRIKRRIFRWKWLLWKDCFPLQRTLRTNWLCACATGSHIISFRELWSKIERLNENLPFEVWSLFYE